MKGTELLVNRVGSILTGNEIMRQRDIGNIVIEPFNREHINPNSYNLTLNPKLKVYKKLQKKPGAVVGGFTGVNEGILPDNKIEPLEIAFLDPKEKDPEMETIIIPEEGFILMPGELYIACINEWTETHGLVPMLNGRSSVGRVGLFVHVTAGFGDIGYCGNWTLELTSVVPVKIYPNMKICQIYYHTPAGEIGQEYSGKYQGLREAQASLFSEDFIVKAADHASGTSGGPAPGWESGENDPHSTATFEKK